MTQKEWIKRWRGNCRYLKKVIEAMPADQYHFRPSPEVKTFLSQASHIVNWPRTHSRFMTGVALEKLTVKTKEEAIEALQNFTDTFLELLGRMEESSFLEKEQVFYGTVSKGFILMTMENHLSHHRGQMITYLKLNGIKPPSYSGW